MKRRNRIDWDEELRKTEEVRMRGFRTSVLSFLVAVLFLVGASRINSDIPVYSYLMMAGCLFAAVVVLVMTLRRRSEIQRKKENRDDDS